MRDVDELTLADQMAVGRSIRGLCNWVARRDSLSSARVQAASRVTVVAIASAWRNRGCSPDRSLAGPC
jgi:hypothetical protein